MAASADLPDEIWNKILRMGVENSKLSYRDLCCVAISGRRLKRLSNEDSLWIVLLVRDFPLIIISQSSHYKTLYRSSFERDKERKLAAHRRAVLRIESQVAVHTRNLRELQVKLMEEKERLNTKLVELSNLHRQRTASVAVKVWQPEIVRGRQKQMVEQSVVPVEYRISSVEMEIRLCRQQIMVFDKTHSDEKHRLNAAKEQLASLKYHPLQDHRSEGMQVNESRTQLKKLKQSRKRRASPIPKILAINE